MRQPEPTAFWTRTRLPAWAGLTEPLKISLSRVPRGFRCESASATRGTTRMTICALEAPAADASHEALDLGVSVVL